MKLKLVLMNWFESDFKDKHYYVYQFVDPQTLTILNYSSLADTLTNFELGTSIMCTVGIKRNKLVVESYDPTAK